MKLSVLSVAAFFAYTSAKQIITPALSTYIQEILDKHELPGLTLGIVNKGETELGAWGIKSEDGDKINVDTRFIIASCSKAFLSTSVGILIDDFAHNRNSTPLPASLPSLTWDTKIKDLLPTSFLGDDGKWLMDEWASEKASLRDILGHHSGVHSHDVSYGSRESVPDTIRRLRHLRPSSELRQKFLYNNQMYTLASYLISIYSPYSYPSFVQHRIFEPLGMSHSSFSLKGVPDFPGSRNAEETQIHMSMNDAIDVTQTWTIKNGKKRRIPFWWKEENIEFDAGPGGVASNVGDLTKWLRALLEASNSSTNSSTLLPAHVIETVTTAQVITSGKATTKGGSIAGYGMGWGRSSLFGHEFITHSGGIPGINTIVSFLPNEGLGIVALVNSDQGYPPALELTIKIVKEALGIEAGETSGDDVERPGVLFSSTNTHRSRSTPPLTFVTPNIRIPASNLTKYAGTYTDLGYGTLTLCAPPDRHASISRYCEEVWEDYRIVDSQAQPQSFTNTTKSAGNYGQPALAGAWDRMWASHIRFKPFFTSDSESQPRSTLDQKLKFKVNPNYLFPHGYGKDKTPFALMDEEDMSFTAEFAVGEDGDVVGFGLFGTDSRDGGKKSDRDLKGGTVQDRADVWFAKI